VVEIEELQFEVSLTEQKLARPYLKNKPGIVEDTCNPRYPRMGWGGRRIVVEGGPGQ
jgi:hypothetical protein